MRDEMFGRLWDAHHENFSADLDQAFGNGAARLRRLAHPAITDIRGKGLLVGVEELFGRLGRAEIAGAPEAPGRSIEEQGVQRAEVLDRPALFQGRGQRLELLALLARRELDLHDEIRGRDLVQRRGRLRHERDG